MTVRGLLIERAIRVVVFFIPHVAFRPDKGSAREPRPDTQLDDGARGTRLPWAWYKRRRSDITESLRYLESASVQC